LFRADKENQGVTETVKGKYERELDRLSWKGTFPFARGIVGPGI